MKDNKQILNEAFFKKASYAEKRDRKMAQYAPVDAKSVNIGKNFNPETGAYQVTDANEVKKRLADTFGATFGHNSVKSMAGRAVKSFPIIVSDNVEPDTIVMLKKLMEEQYAEYINLLVSNQVVDLSNYRSNGEDGNIAIQALDTLSGADFGSAKLADKVGRTGSIDPDTLFSNIATYQLLRENNQIYTSGDAITDSLLEGALIVTPDKVKDAANAILEWNPAGGPTYSVKYRGSETDDYIDKYGYDTAEERSRASRNTKDVRLSRYLMDLEDEDETERADRQYDNALSRDKALDAKRGYQGLDDNGEEMYSKLTTADIVINKDRMDKAINRTVGAILSDPENVEIRDKFEKATFLLQSKRIAGIEYYNYCVLRLGIPVSDKARKELVTRYKIGDVIDPNAGTSINGDFGTIDKKTQKNIAANRSVTCSIVNEITNTKVKNVLRGVTNPTVVAATGAGIGALAMSGASVGGAGGAILGLPGIVLGTILGAAAGGGAALAARAAFAIKNRRARKENSTKIEGWERVERLIEMMDQSAAAVKNPNLSNNKFNDARRREARSNFDNFNNNLDRNTKVNPFINRTDENGDKFVLDNKEDDYNYNTYFDSFKDEKKFYNKNIIIRESVNTLPSNQTFSFMLESLNRVNTPELIRDIEKTINEEIENDKEFKAELLAEKTLAVTSEPMKVKYVETKPGKNLMITPTNYSRADYAYGSIEYERKDMKDRKYNQPLIMTIKFNERFSDGKYSDNELVAVIGIQGKVIRVPSEEMTYVLKEASKGNSVEGLLTGKTDLQNTITDLLSGSKISKDLKGMPQSADIWKNLEKVATLAAANNISGKKNNAIANAHIIFSQKEIDAVRTETGIDYLKDIRKAASLMKRYSAFTLMIANDAGQRVYIFDDLDNISWNVVPYSAMMGKDNGDQLNALINKLGRGGF